MSKPKTTTVQSDDAILEVDSLDVQYATDGGAIPAVRDVSLTVTEGETLGIAGESGSGKSTLAKAVIQHLDSNGSIPSGRISYKGRNLVDLSRRELRDLRGNEIAFVPQDPEQSLNPSMTVGDQIQEAILAHRDVSKSAAKAESIDLLGEVEISDPEYNAEQYPHQLSGGMQQRILVAMALSCDPNLLILDEPTTGLDVTTQAKVLDLVNRLKREYEASVLIITHNLRVLAQVANEICIMYAGEIVERGRTSDVFTNPANPYTQGLLAATPNIHEQKELLPIQGTVPDPQQLPSGCVFADRCEFAEEACRVQPIHEEVVSAETDHRTKCRRWETAVEDPIEADLLDPSLSEGEKSLLAANNVKKFFGEYNILTEIFGDPEPVKAVNGADIEIHESQAAALVGESGSGKSTLGRVLVKLLDATEGDLSFRGKDIENFSEAEMKQFRSEVQIVFQNNDKSLNPRHRVQTIIERPLKLYTDKNDEQREDRVTDLLDRVGLGDEYLARYPHELSGGEKQRVAIARAFAAEPSFVVLDEPVSALDMSVQSSILTLLDEMRAEYDASFLLISHDLSVVQYISDKISVMYLGQIMEVGNQESIFEPPYHPYTRALISSIPPMDPDEPFEPEHLEGTVPSSRDGPQGCPFHTRCPHKIGDVCESERPEPEPVESTDDESHRIACHLDETEMSAPLDADTPSPEGERDQLE